ncbi:DUF2268 domain-containing putative Zn-dependent protease [Virgibacillus kekensis]|uniref:DUF2268 domain-containing putative Zn-dependent protease n=1 Tax=Virgibacillus kekensis TaxID=202261 RepID=A0ABV9DPB3_9BACI
MKFKDFEEEEALSYQWDTDKVKNIIEDTVLEVRELLSLGNLNITVVPALSFPWLENHDRSIWTNGFTNSPNCIQIAIPPTPDEDFLKYMIAHELHHASPINPIYNLTDETFTLGEWFKMEGTAEFFSLSLYKDKRWWKSDFTKTVEKEYWSKVQDKFAITDDSEMGKFCFGDLDNGIPYMAGYAFAYEMVKKYVEKHPIDNYEKLYSVGASDLVDTYSSRII